MESLPAELRRRMEELKDLFGIQGLLTWDQETYLPPKGHAARGHQLATLQGLYHERLVDPVLGALLERAAQSPLSAEEAAMVRVLTHERSRAVKVPVSLVRALAEAQSEGVARWREARERADFRTFAPALERLLALRREQADAIGHSGERYDALLDAYEPGMTVARVAPVLEALRHRLVPIVEALAPAGAPAPPDPLAGRTFDPDRQWRFTLELLEAMRFDFSAGRQDRSIHPFTGGTHPHDVRLTNRIDPANVFSAIFSAIHEGGHGLYEQGFAEILHRTPLASAASMGLHESQSRLWENLIGRSRPFWEHWYPRLRRLFPAELDGVSLDAFLGSMNAVRRTLIRVDSDEVTYNLHIALRFELERLILDGSLPVADLPGAWNERMEGYLGVRPPDDVKGVLQDIHWAFGDIGYFPTYSIGNLYAAQLFEALRRELGDVDALMRRGELAPIREWLRERIHAPGYLDPAEDRVRQVTGEGLSDEAFVRYLRGKYGA